MRSKGSGTGGQALTRQAERHGKGTLRQKCYNRTRFGTLLSSVSLVERQYHETLRVQPRLPRVYAAKRCAPRTHGQKPDITPSETVQDADQKSGVRR